MAAGRPSCVNIYGIVAHRKSRKIVGELTFASSEIDGMISLAG